MKSTLMERILELYKQSPRIALLMSGKGSNAEVILNNAQCYPNLNFVTICTDQKSSNASQLSKLYGLEYFCLEGNISGSSDRELYFKQLATYLHSLKIDTLIYAGFMKISPPFFVNEFPGINVHPADLTIKNIQNKPQYVGMHAIKNAVQDGETYLASTAHVVDTDVDCGSPIMISKPLSLTGRLTTDIGLLHEQLKVSCEHLLYPCVLELLSKGQLDVEKTPYKWDELSDIKPKLGGYFTNKLLAMKELTSPLDLAYLSQDYSSEAGFDFSTIEQVMGKVKEEFGELMEAFDHRQEQFEHFVDEIGDCFFSLVNLCRFIQLHPEAVVKKNVMKYLDRCSYIEKMLEKNQKNWAQIEPKEIKTLWKQAKEYERTE
jgi:folate-dependent phosphoribosylglycinamide formyltransferase PurN/NTP pyrophosphatase (non-canonical NTP hydrolase)